MRLIFYIISCAMVNGFAIVPTKLMNDIRDTSLEMTNKPINIFETELDDFMSMYFPIVDREGLDTPFKIFHGRVPHVTDIPTSHFPEYNIAETEDEFLIIIMLPSFDASDIRVHVEGAREFASMNPSHPLFGDSFAIKSGASILRVVGDRKMHLADEYLESTFRKSFALAKCIDANRIDASMQKGRLILTLPKVEQDLTKRVISVNISEDSYAKMKP